MEYVVCLPYSVFPFTFLLISASTKVSFGLSSAFFKFFSEELAKLSITLTSQTLRQKKIPSQVTSNEARATSDNCFFIFQTVSSQSLTCSVESTQFFYINRQCPPCRYGGTLFNRSFPELPRISIRLDRRYLSSKCFCTSNFHSIRS